MMLERQKAHGLRNNGSIREVVTEFAQKTTIHGINRLLSTDSTKYERCVWLLTVVMALCGSFYVGLILYDQFSDARIQTVIDDPQLPVYNIDFPEVVLCNENSLNWTRFDEAKRMFLPPQSTEKMISMFERIMVLYDGFRFNRLGEFSTLESEPLQLLDAVNFSRVYRFMTWRCEEFFASCQWQAVHMNCCEIFTLRRSQYGLCWGFNDFGMEELAFSNDRVGLRTSNAGSKSGLVVKVFTNTEHHVPHRKNEKGILAMILQPKVWHAPANPAPENTYMKIQLNPILHFHGNETRSLSYEKRQCIFDSDFKVRHLFRYIPQNEHTQDKYSTLHGVVYMYENCLAQCKLEHLVRFCNCTMDFLFPPAPFRPCQLLDLLCVARHIDQIKYVYEPDALKYVRRTNRGIVCKCLHNCHSLNYHADLRYLHLTSRIRDNLSYVELDVFYHFESLIVLRTSLIFGWVDLLGMSLIVPLPEIPIMRKFTFAVALGGIAGLFLGCSLISFLELVYFMLAELSYYVYEQLKQYLKSHLRATRTSPLKLKATQHKGMIILVKTQHHKHYSKNEKHAGKQRLYPLSISNKLPKL